MTTEKFIKQAIGNIVYVIGDGDLAFNGGLRSIIFNKTPLKLIKVTKAGYAYLFDETINKYYSVPPRNVREIDNMREIDKNGR